MKGTILYFGNFEMPDKNAAAHRVVNNGKIFRALGYRVVYLGTVRDEAFDEIRVSSYDENIFEEAYPEGTKAWIKHIFDVSNIRAVAGRFDDLKIIIAYNAPYRTFLAVKKAFRREDVTVAYDCTEWNDFAEGSFPKRLYKKLDESKIRNRLGKKCRNMIVISRKMEEKYRGCNLLRLPPLVDTDDVIWHQDPESHPDVFEFCFSGTVSNKESLDAVVKAFAGIDDEHLRLRIIGLSADEYEVAYPEHADIMGRDARIVFMGYISHEESVRYILSSDCYIFIREKTRRNEAGFPTKFAEAFTCGVPIITTDVSDVGEYIDSAEKGTVLNALSPEVIAATMIKAARNALPGRKSVETVFDYKNYICETDKWIDQYRTN